MDAGFHVGRRRAVHVLGEIRHGASQALMFIHVALRIVTWMRVLDRQALFAGIEGIFFCDIAHTLAPRRVNVTPVV